MKKIHLAVLLAVLSVLSGCGEQGGNGNPVQAEQGKEVPVMSSPSDQSALSSPENNTPIYLTDSLINLTAQRRWNSAIRDKRTGENHFYIDADGVLWGTGRNEYWQLGIEKEEDRGNLDAVYTTPVKIAENVIHVDASDNAYFVIYITGDHKLYGLGANTCGVLRMPAVPEERYNMHQNLTGEPRLLMEHVNFVSAGRESVSAITEDGDVWWWGTFQSTSATTEMTLMQETEPVRMVTDGTYTACGSTFAAAIDQNGTLWTWGNNVWGQCSAAPSQDYIHTPVQVCGQVDMVWTERLSSGNDAGTLEYDEGEHPYTAIDYPYTLFIRKEDGGYFACGIDLGEEEKTMAVWGDISKEDGETQTDYTHLYSDQFVPIQVCGVSEQADIPETYEKQLDLILACRGQWEDSCAYGDSAPYYYAVTDLNQNGRLEILSSVVQGTGYYSYNSFLEVKEDLTGLQDYRYEERREGDSQADIIGAFAPVYYEEEADTYYYIFDDYIKNGMAERYYNRRSLALTDGVVREQPLAYRSVIYHGGDIDSEPEVTAKDANQQAISQEEYRQIGDQAYGGLEKGLAKFLWFSLTDGGVGGAGEISDEELAALLRESWAGFGIELYPVS